MANNYRQIRTNFKVPKLLGRAIEADADNHDRPMSKQVKEVLIEHYDSEKIAALLKKNSIKKAR